LVLEQRAIGDASRRLHFDFGFFVGTLAVDSGHNDQRLRTIGQIEFALELQRLHAALLARVFLQRGLEHFRLGMQLVGDFRGTIATTIGTGD